jgi:hypothetical protein
MRYKVIMILLIVVFFVLSMGLTYSYFNSETTLNTVDQRLAHFVFDTETLDRLELPLIDLTPGVVNSYNFSISNTSNDVTSDVTIEYELTILTPHFAPLIIELYKDDELILSCDETYSRNDNNELVCNSSVQELSHDSEYMDDYTLEVTFDDDYDDEIYSNLIDYINIEIKSYQKV